MNRSTTLVATGLALFALTGCAAATPPTPGSSETSQPIRTTLPHTGDSSTTQAPPPAGLMPSDAAAAVDAAHDVMTRYARPTLTPTAWIDGMDPVLTQDAAAEFAGTDPSQIPAHHVTGRPTLSSDSTASGVVASVPTDAGTYQVFLLRADGTTTWLAEQITPPGN